MFNASSGLKVKLFKDIANIIRNDFFQINYCLKMFSCFKIKISNSNVPKFIYQSRKPYITAHKYNKKPQKLVGRCKVFTLTDIPLNLPLIASYSAGRRGKPKTIFFYKVSWITGANTTTSRHWALGSYFSSKADIAKINFDGYPFSIHHYALIIVQMCI